MLHGATSDLDDVNPKQAFLDCWTKLAETMTCGFSTRIASIITIALGVVSVGFPGHSNPTESSELGAWTGSVEEVVFCRPDGSLHHREFRLRTPGGPLVFMPPGEFTGKLSSGDQVSIRGTRTGGRVTASHLELLGSASQCSAVDEQRVMVLLVTFPGEPPSLLTRDQIRDVFFGGGMSLKSYWEETSYGRARVTGDVVGWLTLSRAYNCDEDDQLRQAAIDAADSVVDFRSYDRLFIVFPRPSGCRPFIAGWAYIGCISQTSPGDGAFQASAAWLPLDAHWLDAHAPVHLLIHEGGHGLGLGHAIFRYWDLIEPLGPPGQPGRFDQPYSDDSTSMGTGIAHYNAHEKSRLGWLQDGVDAVTVGNTGSFTLKPLASGTTGIRGLRIRRGTQSERFLWLENRRPIGVFDGTLDPVTTGWKFTNGANVHYVDEFTGGDSHLVDFTPGSPGLNTDTPLPTGRSWTDPYTNLSLNVRSAGSGDDLVIDVAFQASCATLSPTSRDHGIGVETGTIQVSSAADCIWSATTDTSWITITSGSAGAGNGTIGYRVDPDQVPRLHTGVIRVGGERFLINRPAAPNLAPVAESVTPSSGAGFWQTFGLMVRDDNGGDDVARTRLIVNTSNAVSDGCVVEGYLITKQVFLYGDDGRTGTIGSLGSTGWLYNSQCAVDLAGSSMVTVGTRTRVTYTLAFDPSFAGSKSIFADAFDRQGLKADVGFLGSWTVPEVGVAGFVPIVLDVTGFAHYTSEMQLTNLGARSATVKLSYRSSIGSGAGEVLETLPTGRQVVYPDAIAYLRSRNVSIPASGDQGGAVLLSTPAAGVRATVRTTAETMVPQPVGRVGLAYTDTDPAVASSAAKLYVYGLRTNDADRSNLAVYNMGADPVSLRVILVSGDEGNSFEVTAGVPRVLPAYGWYQYNGVLNAAGFSSGYAIVERVSGSAPFGTYGVINDQLTNDGSFIPAHSEIVVGRKVTVPVLVETSAFESELILTNRGSATATFTLRYFESLSPAGGPGGTTTVDVDAGRQRIIPQAIGFLRSKGVTIGARGEASYAGSLQVEVSGVGLENTFAGSRSSSLSPAGGQFGLFYPAVGSNEEFSDSGFVLGLKADANNRSNVAAIHTGVDGLGPITLEFQALDGSDSGKAVGQPFSVSLNPGGWVQPSGFFASAGVPNGYVRIRRTAGTAPWFAYGVINDGGQPGQRTGDGSYVPGVRP